MNRKDEDLSSILLESSAELIEIVEPKSSKAIMPANLVMKKKDKFVIGSDSSALHSSTRLKQLPQKS